jgi:hypothetical protein
MREKAFVDHLAKHGDVPCFPSNAKKIWSVAQPKTRANVSATSRLGT